jgi:hypothetical protein
MKWPIIALLGMALALLIADRLLRIQPYIQKVHVVNESFQQPPLGSARCGLGMKPCKGKCANGYCISTEPVSLVEKYPLPVLP